MTIMTYCDAGILALRQEMTRDPTVWALGEDLAEGGANGQYRGLRQEFGPERVVGTPISESTIMGAGVGAAIAGTRPVIELRYVDFAICAADEIVNQAAKIRYMFNGQARASLVIRQSIGARAGYAAQHSQSLEAWWVHIPGLVVVAPATPADNHALLKAAIRSDDPVVYMEHKELWGLSGEVNPGAGAAELGRAETVARGDDLTIVTWSNMRQTSLAAAETLRARGVGAEVIDLRTLWPWDRDAVLASVARTGRLLIVHESVRCGGFGAEIAADVGEALWGKLRSPVRRLGLERVPMPFSKPLEAHFRLSSGRIVAAALTALDPSPQYAAAG
jgi:acetoin:2,6-dichlorophenolindophenol oxidoreductase subunit beta